MYSSGKYGIILMLFFIPFFAYNQSHNYWSRSFNEESSLLSGAVVGGGAGPSAIYYNPASISEITESKFTFNVSLFSYTMVGLKNALGDGIDLNSNKLAISPRFFSYMIKPKNHPELSFEIAFLNNENYRMDFNQNVDYIADVLTHVQGDERYYAFFQYSNHYRDDWLGIGGSWTPSENFHLGVSMFVMVRSLEYRYSLDIDAYPVSDSVVIDGEPIPFFSATSQYQEYLKFNNYRLLWKVGMMYTKNRFSFGLTLTTPSVGVYSDGKRVSRKSKENNIRDPETGDPIPGFVLEDYQEKKSVDVNYRSPLSFAAGLNYAFKGEEKMLYTTIEFFNGIDSYKMVEANESQSIAAGLTLENVEYNEWLTFLSGARPVFNIALGYRSMLRKDLMLMSGFRTDFNYRKGMDYMDQVDERVVKGLDINIYHLSGGLSLNIRKQALIMGLQYSFGLQDNMKQIANLSDPVEYNYEEKTALKGTRTDSMTSLFNSLSLYFGATFNFGGGGDK